MIAATREADRRVRRLGRELGRRGRRRAGATGLWSLASHASPPRSAKSACASGSHAHRNVRVAATSPRSDGGSAAATSSRLGARLGLAGRGRPRRAERRRRAERTLARALARDVVRRRPAPRARRARRAPPPSRGSGRRRHAHRGVGRRGAVDDVGQVARDRVGRAALACEHRDAVRGREAACVRPASEPRAIRRDRRHARRERLDGRVPPRLVRRREDREIDPRERRRIRQPEQSVERVEVGRDVDHRGRDARPGCRGAPSRTRASANAAPSPSNNACVASPASGPSGVRCAVQAREQVAPHARHAHGHEQERDHGPPGPTVDATRARRSARRAPC